MSFRTRQDRAFLGTLRRVATRHASRQRTRCKSKGTTSLVSSGCFPRPRGEYLSFVCEMSSISPKHGAHPPPDGVTPNFTDPENRDTMIYSVIGVCVFITTTLVFVRTYTRLVIMRNRGWQDCQ